jgi:hypothetical protein
MRKVAIGLCAMVVVVFTGWTAEAAPPIPPVTKYSPVETVGCGGPGRCPWGRHWRCAPEAAGAHPAAVSIGPTFVLMRVRICAPIDGIITTSVPKGVAERTIVRIVS